MAKDKGKNKGREADQPDIRSLFKPIPKLQPTTNHAAGPSFSAPVTGPRSFNSDSDFIELSDLEMDAGDREEAVLAECSEFESD